MQNVVFEFHTYLLMRLSREINIKSYKKHEPKKTYLYK